jgi:hypothetical protein
MSEANQQENAVSPDPAEAPIAPIAESTYLDFDNSDTLPTEAVKARMGEITRKGRDRERELQAQLQQSEDTAQKLRQEALNASKPVEVLAPTADLAIDNPDEFTAQQQRREDFLKSQSTHTAKVEQNEQALKQSVEIAQQEKLNTFQGNAQSDGLDMPTLNNAVNVVVSSGVSPEVADFLLTDKAGPKLAIELAKNPLQLQEIAGMTSMNAAIKLNVMSQSLSKPKVPSAPPPAETLSGSGKAPTNGIMQYATGATFK